MVLNKNINFFIVYITFFSLKTKITIYLAQKIQITLLNIELVPKNILIKYLQFANIFSKMSAIELLKHLGINKHTINLKKSKQLPYYKWAYEFN